MSTTIYFVTGNNEKFSEAKSIITNLERIEIDLPEEQSLDPKIVISKKTRSSKKISRWCTYS